jgi:hypothetical protein
MLTARDIAAYRVICLSLPGGEILDRYTDEQAAAICNGVGAAWADKVAPHASGILNRALPWAVAPSIIHDLAYHEGEGGDSGRAAADYLFWTGCCEQIDVISDYPWTRWWRIRKAWALYILLRQYGWFAWEGKR